MRVFTPPGTPESGLRAWKGSIIAGSPNVVRLIAEDVAARRHLLSPIGPLWRRLRAGEESSNGTPV
jgi:hypothetical protein